MPVSSFHPSFGQNLAKWQRVRHVLGGEDEIKGAGEVYLPRLSEQTNDEYEAYKMRASFFNATGRTHDGMLGLLFDTDPEVTTEAKIEPWLDDATMTGVSFFEFAKHVASEVLGPGRFGVFVDFDPEEKRPYLVGYSAEQIINWQTTRVGNKSVVSRIVLKETIDEMVDEFSTQAVTQFRELVLDMSGAKPVFKVFIHRKKADPKAKDPKAAKSPAMDPDKSAEDLAFGKVDEKRTLGSDYEVVAVIQPGFMGGTFDFIPFAFVGPRNNEPEIARPPLEDVLLVNLSHYRSSADLEHGRHFTALPTAWVKGFPAKSKLRIGASAAWVTENVNADAKFLEFTGKGLDYLENALKDKEGQMAVLGARLLEQQKKQAEAAQTHEIRQNGENSALGAIATTVGTALSRALQYMNAWATGKLDEDPKKNAVEINTDFTSNKIDAPTLTALTAAFQARAISQPTYLFNLKKAEILPPDISPEDEIERINDDQPALTTDQQLAVDAQENAGDQFDAQHKLATKSQADSTKLAKDALKAKSKAGAKK